MRWLARMRKRGGVMMRAHCWPELSRLEAWVEMGDGHLHDLTSILYQANTADLVIIIPLPPHTESVE